MWSSTFHLHLVLRARPDVVRRWFRTTFSFDLGQPSAGHVTEAGQVMNLLCLAPDLQEQILFLPATERRRNAIAEKQIRPIAGVLNWRKQRRMWGALQGECGRKILL